MIKTKRSNKRNTKCSIFFELTEKVIGFFRYYSLSLSEANYKAKYWKVLKMITPKQMLQRSPIALA